MIDFKGNPTMQAGNMHKLIMEKYGVTVPGHTYDRAVKLQSHGWMVSMGSLMQDL